MPDDRLTKLQRVMRLAYEMRADETAVLAREMERQRTAAWMDAMRTEARKVGYKGPIPSPRGEALDMIRRQSITDARGVTETYNRDLERAIVKLYDANPRGNRNYYMRGIERWHAERARWKNKQIALMNDKSARHWAVSAFVEQNSVQSRYRFAGPAPVCDDCAEMFAAGVVDQAFVDKTPAPLHPNCPHFWSTVRPKLGVPLSQLWVGQAA